LRLLHVRQCAHNSTEPLPPEDGLAAASALLAADGLIAGRRPTPRPQPARRRCPAPEPTSATACRKVAPRWSTPQPGRRTAAIEVVRATEIVVGRRAPAGRADAAGPRAVPGRLRVAADGALVWSQRRDPWSPGSTRSSRRAIAAGGPFALRLLTARGDRTSRV
jgi:hypothetical protein